MKAQIDPRSGVTGLIHDGKLIGPGEMFTISRADFDRINDAPPRKVLVEVAEVGNAEPENDDDDEVQED